MLSEVVAVGQTWVGGTSSWRRSRMSSSPEYPPSSRPACEIKTLNETTVGESMVIYHKFFPFHSPFVSRVNLTGGVYGPVPGQQDGRIDGCFVLFREATNPQNQLTAVALNCFWFRIDDLTAIQNDTIRRYGALYPPRPTM